MPDDGPTTRSAPRAKHAYPTAAMASTGTPRTPNSTTSTTGPSVISTQRMAVTTSAPASESSWAKWMDPRGRSWREKSDAT